RAAQTDLLVDDLEVRVSLVDLDRERRKLVVPIQKSGRSQIVSRINRHRTFPGLRSSHAISRCVWSSISHQSHITAALAISSRSVANVIRPSSASRWSATASSSLRLGTCMPSSAGSTEKSLRAIAVNSYGYLLKSWGWVSAIR